MPTTADDVFFDTNSGSATSTISAAITIKSLDMTGSTAGISHSAVALTVSGGTGSVFTLAGAGKYLANGGPSASITFTGTTATNSITTAGNIMGNITFNGTSGGWKLLDSLTASSTLQTVTLTAGTLDTNGQTMSIGLFASPSSGTRVLTLGSSVINISGIGTALNVGITNLTVTTNTATATLSGAGADATLGSSKNYDGLSLVLSGSGDQLLTANGSTFANITRTGTEAKTDALSVSGTAVVTGTLTLNGNSATNRILVTSATLGTAATFTNTGATMTWSNVDFRDITISTAYNASAITGLSGDAGGNSGITFTTAETQTWSGTSGGNWSANAWTSRVPLPQDNVVIGAMGTSQTITADMPRLGSNIDFSGATWTTALTWNYASSINQTMYGSLTLKENLTLATGLTLFNETRTTSTFTSAGRTFGGSMQFNMVGGTMTLQDNLAFNSSVAFALNNGTFNANNFNVSAGRFTSLGTATRALTIGTGTWTISGDSALGSVWALTSTGMTLASTDSTISFTSTSTNTKTFAGGGLTYNNFTITGGGAGAVIIQGSNTFNTFTIGAPKTVQFTAATTQTVTSFAATGTAINGITINSDTTATHALVKAGGGTISGDYLNIQHSVASPASTWYAGANSTDNQAVATAGSGWIFTALPVTTLADGTDPSNSTVAPSSSITDLDSFTLATDSGTDSVTALTVTLASGTFAGLSEVRVTSSDGSTTYFSSATDPSSATVSFSGGTPIPVSTSATTFKIRITPKTHANMPAVPGASYSTTGTITAFTSTNSQSGTDTDSATITVDNDSPDNAASATGTTGDAEVALTWTNPVDSDFSNVLIFRSTSAVSDTPVEGSSPLVDDTVGGSTVRYILNGTSFTDSTLSNDTAYHYLIFAKDSNGNYSQTGVIPTGSPLTPVAVVAVAAPTSSSSRSSRGGERSRPSYYLPTPPPPVPTIPTYIPIPITVTAPKPVPIPTLTLTPAPAFTPPQISITPKESLAPLPIQGSEFDIKTPSSLITPREPLFSISIPDMPDIPELTRLNIKKFVTAPLNNVKLAVFNTASFLVNQIKDSAIYLVSLQLPRLSFNFNQQQAEEPELPTLEPKDDTIAFRSGELELIASADSPVQTIVGFKFNAEVIPSKKATGVGGTYRFSDIDDDGVWTAQVGMPDVSGEFKLNTIIAYADGDIKEIQSDILIDPEGYVYEEHPRGKTSIENARVTLWHMNDKGEWEVWSAQRYNQLNPQITNDRGEYSFLAPAGRYYIQVVVKDYQIYTGVPFDLSQARPIHEAIKLEYIGND